MSSLYALLKKTTTAFKRAGIHTPDLDARILLENVLQKDRTFLLLNLDYVLTDAEYFLYKQYCKRRLEREPVATILGEKEFWSISFKTTKDTLDPRPDSETLIEAVLDQFPDKTKPYRVLDLGTGTGCLLLTILSEYKNATGTGVDFSPEALGVAKDNATALNLTDRASFLQSNWCQDVKGEFDIILSNPPYIPPSHKTTLEPELAFDPQEALYGQSHDGLDAYRLLSQQIKKYLDPQGKIFLEFGKDQHNDVKEIMGSADLYFIKWYKDLGQIIRCGVFDGA